MPPDEPQERRRFIAGKALTGGGVGWAMASDIITGTFLFGGLGWLVDRWLGSDPWVMIGGFVLGHGLGIYAATLHMKRMQREQPPPAWTPRSDDDDPPSDW